MPPPEPRRGLWRGLLGMALLLALGGPHTLEAPSPRAPASPEGTLWAGCEELERSPEGEPITCTLYSDERPDESTLRVWLPSGVAEPVVSLDGVVITADTAEVDDGWGLILHPSHGGRLIVSGHVDGSWKEFLTLDIDYRPRPDKDLRDRLDGMVGDHQAQRAMAAELREELRGDIEPSRRLLLTRYLYYVLHDLGDHREATEIAIEAARLARAQGKPMAECSSAWSASFFLGEDLGDKGRAFEVLETMCRDQGSLPEVELKGSYHRALLELAEGRSSRARGLLQRAAQVARRLRWPRWQLTVLNPLVESLANQGRFDWARQVLEQMRELEAAHPHEGVLGPCKSESRYHRKRGALAFREAELHDTSLEPAREYWLEAREIIVDRTRCPDHSSVRDQAQRVDVDLAFVALERGELAVAQAFLEGIPRTTVATTTDVRRRLVQAGLALARDEVETAARVLEELEVDRRQGKLGDGIESEDDWLLQLTWARIHEQRGELSAALLALNEAQAHIDRSRGISGVETDRHAAMRRKSSQLLVRLLLEHGLLHQALCSARVARARGLMSLEPLLEDRARAETFERSRAKLFEGYKWYDLRDIPIDRRMRHEAEQYALETRLSAQSMPVECDQLPTGSSGEASVLYFRDGEGFLGFGWGANGRVLVQRLSKWSIEDSPESLAEVLISPFTEVLEGATRLRVLSPAAMHEVSFADLPWQGRPLGEGLAVVHALDLPAIPMKARRDGSAVVVFSDPNKKLAHEDDSLRDRFQRWREGLEAKAFDVTFLGTPWELPSHVSVTDVLRQTRGVELAVLYGFGAVRPSYYDLLSAHDMRPEPDQDGFGVGADVLTRSDLLLEMGMVPRHVILAHCDSAIVDAYGISGAIGLAQSYVQAGAEWAVGTVGDVSSKSMEIVVDELLETLPRGASVDDVAMALQQAKRELEQQDLRDDAARLRLWSL
ncbi:CHAT domain-containing protein [Paraliomyxa miuraensis]|uniref:CHAT domain-containing protein n=1 Tax=Paraliomyxa miuraensis TaxID=376150 RepID=UPI00225A794A|nr:CHAT domain-containing protein [Paraliomyxa miuraensis]MCX4240589.1 CHAT domain-containing protein [Paraliomyxa miuraensis]